MGYNFRYSKQIKQGLFVLCAAAILAGLYLTSLHSYLLFHTVSELFTIAIAFAMFIIVWNGRQFIEDNYLSFIGIAFLFIGSLDLVHTLAYKGMGVFQGYNPDIATQLWIASRYLHSVSFLAAAFFIRRKLRQDIIVFIYSIITAFVLLSIFYWENFPVCFVEGTGLTKFKDISETVICSFFVIAILLLYLNRKQFKKSVLAFLFVSLFLSICSELAFTLYGSVYGSANLAGHYFKIISFYLIYMALVKTQPTDPYSTLFRNLKQNEKFLAEEQKRLESILNAIPDGIYIVNQNHNIEYINPTMRSIFGEINGKKCYEYIYGSDKPCSLCKFSEVVDGKTVRIESVSTNGRVYDTIDTPFVNLHTGQLSKLKILRDMTELKQAEQALCESEKRYRGLVEMSPNALFVNRNNRIEFVNPAAMKLFGVTDEKQILGKSPFDVFHPDCHLGIRERIQKLMDGHPVPMIEEKIIRLDGTIRDVYCLRLSFPVFKRPECGSFLSAATAIPAGISSAFEKNVRMHT